MEETNKNKTMEEKNKKKTMEEKNKRKIEPAIHWVGLIGAVYVLFMIDGILKSYGLLFLELLDKYDQGPQKTGFVATVFAIGLIVTGPVIGRLIDMFGAWLILLVSALIGAVGAIMAAFAPTLTLVHVGYGVFVGIATGAAFVATTTAVAQVFLYNRTLALGITFAGGSLGTIIYPLIFRLVVPIYTLGGMLLFMAVFKLNYMVAALLFFAGRNEKQFDTLEVKDASIPTEDVRGSTVTESLPAVQTEKKGYKAHRCGRVIIYIKAFLTLRFLSMCLWYFTYVYAIFGYLMYFPPYAEELEIADLERAALISVYGATDLVSRIAVGFLGGLSWVSIYHLTSINMIIVGIITVLLPKLLSLGPVYPILIGHMSVTGLFAGGIFGLLGTFVVNAVGTEKAGTGTGISIVFSGLALLIPPNIYGSLKVYTGSYVWVPYLSGTSFLLCAVVIQIGEIPRYLKKLSCHSKSLAIN